MSKVTLHIVDQQGLAPYLSGLSALEESILYPIDDGTDHFFIDHGPTYHEFFTRMGVGGKARFMVALAGDEVIGSMVGVWREARFGAKTHTGLYFCDLKLSKAWRGHKLVQRMLWHALRQWPKSREFRGWRFIYMASMRGAGKDLSHSFRGWHPGKLVQPVNVQSLYFVPAETLAALPGGGPPPPENPDATGLDFSPTNAQSANTISTGGRKDLRLQSSGEPWPLVHLPKGPAHWPAHFGDHLRRCGESIHKAHPNAIACFGLDQRLTPQIEWLASQGLSRGAQCAIHGFSIPGLAPQMGRYPWIHLSSADI